MGHGNHRIEGGHKKRYLRLTGKLLCRIHHQMATSRETHAPHAVLPNAILRGISAHTGKSPRQIIITGRKTASLRTHMECKCTPSSMTVFQHKCRNTILTEPFSHLATLMILIQPEITSPRTDDHAHLLRILVWDIWRQLIGSGTMHHTDNNNDSPNLSLPLIFYLPLFK